MVVVKIMGGLGNQLFQYCLGRKLAILNGVDLKLDISDYNEKYNRKFSLSNYNIKADVIKPMELLRFGIVKDHRYVSEQTKRIVRYANRLLKYDYRIITESGFTYQKEVLAEKGNIYLFGYWQSEKYFYDIRDIIVKELSLKQKLNTENIRMAEAISGSNSVAVHIRRGDYITDKNANTTHGVCSLDYYYSAIEKINKNVTNPVLFIFSDDINWAKENLQVKNEVVFVDINDDDSNYYDLYLMTVCKHHIVANSSFSWWGAWLSENDGKMVIAPQKWFSANYDTRDLIPETWIRM